MRAVVIHQFGEPGTLTTEEVPTPEPMTGEVLVEVKAAGINPSDVKNVMGKMHRTTLPRIPGRDFAGIAVRGPQALLGREVFGTGGDIGFVRDGSHAQFIALPEGSLTPKPAALSMEAAGIAGLRFVTAWSAIVVAAQLAAGETVLVIGAAGSVGSAAVQIALSRGARVIAAVRSAEEVAAARANGASEAIDTTSVSLVESVQKLTGNRGAEVVFDTSGMTFAAAVEAAAENGRVPVIAAPGDGKAEFNLRSLYRKVLRVIGIDTVRLDSVACAALLREMLPDFESGKFKVKPDRLHPLGQAAQAYEEAAHGAGRIVLLPNP